MSVVINKILAAIFSVIVGASIVPAAAYEEAQSPSFDTCEMWTRLHSTNTPANYIEGAREEDYFLYGFAGGAEVMLQLQAKDLGRELPALNNDRHVAVTWVNAWCRNNPHNTVYDAAMAYVGSEIRRISDVLGQRF